MLPIVEQNLILASLASILEDIILQRLVEAVDGGRMARRSKSPGRWPESSSSYWRTEIMRYSMHSKEEQGASLENLQSFSAIIPLLFTAM